VKTKNSVPQSLLKKSERRKNIRKVFEVVSPETVSGKNILLVDDLMTTGATLREAAGALKKAGAKTVAGSVTGRA
jgi:predicted amidophosphoribosyltransferase